MSVGVDTNTDIMSGMCALLICGYGQNIPPCTSALGSGLFLAPAVQEPVALRQDRQKLRFCAILSNVAVRSYDGALRSSMVLVGGVEVAFPTLMRS